MGFKSIYPKQSISGYVVKAIDLKAWAASEVG